jgi:hypothetical protein
MTNTPQNASKGARDFSEQYNVPSRSVVSQLGQFVAATGKWWLLPVFLALAIAAILIVLGSTAAAPFIYTIF